MESMKIDPACPDQVHETIKGRCDSEFNPIHF